MNNEETLREKVSQLARDLGMPEPLNRTEARQILGRLKRASGTAKKLAMLKSARTAMKNREKKPAASRQRALFRIQ